MSVESQAALKASQSYYDLYRNKGIEDIQRSNVVSRRKSYSTPEDISRFSQQYDVTAAKDLSTMGLNQANLENEAQYNEANTWGGVSPYSGASIQGQLPYQSQQNEIQRQWNRKLQEDQWNVQQKIASQQSANALWGSIFGAVGSILPFTGIFGGDNKKQGGGSTPDYNYRNYTETPSFM